MMAAPASEMRLLIASKDGPLVHAGTRGRIFGKAFIVQSILAKILSLGQLNDTRRRENMHAREGMQSDGKKTRL